MTAAEPSRMPPPLIARLENAAEIRLSYRLVAGVHWFRSPDVPGLCAAHKDFRLAAEAVGYQLAALLPSKFAALKAASHDR